jgi:hypothetical protein
VSLPGFEPDPSKMQAKRSCLNQLTGCPLFPYTPVCGYRFVSVCVLYFRIYILKLLQLYTGRQYTGHIIMVFSLFRISYFRWRYRYPEVTPPPPSPRIVNFVHYEVHIVPLGFSLALSQLCRNSLKSSCCLLAVLVLIVINSCTRLFTIACDRSVA